MKIGLMDIDSHNSPNLALMKLSAWHKSQGDDVVFFTPATYLPAEWYLNPFDKFYISKVFTFSQDCTSPIYAKEIIYGGSGYDLKSKLPEGVESIYPDYALYGITDTAYGFLTRGCPRNCEFCIVGQKEGCKSIKVADLSHFWRGQKYIKLLDPNLLACAERVDLLEQLANSKAYIDFTQGLDIRLMNEDITHLLMKCKTENIHFAWDNEKDSDLICQNLKEFKQITGYGYWRLTVYMLTNFNTSFDFDKYRVYTLKELGYNPFVMIYNKDTAPKRYIDLQRWVNNRRIFRSGNAERFEDYNAK